MQPVEVVRRLPGLVERRRPLPAGAPTPTVAIIGAGFSGLGMAIRLRQAGIGSFTIFEKNDGVGGTWRENTYPGAACDVPSHLYSFSFERRSGWSKLCPPQSEILDYLEDLVARHDLAPHLRTGTAVTSLHWEDGEQRWRLTTAGGQVHHADVVVSGLGQLNRPAYPDIDGLERFAGTMFHSARWDHGHDLAGERVAVIGNGASAVQFVPRIASEVGQLHVFQRSPYWMLPRGNHAYPPWVKEAFARVPGLERAYRTTVYLAMESLFLAFKDPGRVSATMAERSLRYLREAVPDPDLRRALTPDYPFGCKRVLFADDYYPALLRDNVELVTDAITAVEPDAVVTADGTRRRVDTIIAATGFHATEFLAPLEVKGRSGRSLADAWHDGAEAYRGVAVSGFPNLFMLYGPNTNLGHNSILLMVERQIDYVLQLLRAMSTGSIRWVDVRADRQAAYNDRLQEELHRTVWEAGCESWYKTEAGRVTNNWPGFAAGYWWEMLRPDLADFETAPPLR